MFSTLSPTRLRSLRPSGAILITLLLATAGCGDSTSPEVDQLTRHESIWAASGLTDYTYDVQRVCFCPFRESGVRITVVGGVLTAAIDIASGDPLPSNELEWYHTIDGLFDLVRDAYDREAASVQVEFDSTRGYPTTIYIDYSEMVADEELGFTLLSAVQPSN